MQQGPEFERVHIPSLRSCVPVKNHALLGNGQNFPKGVKQIQHAKGKRNHDQFIRPLQVLSHIHVVPAFLNNHYIVQTSVGDVFTQNLRHTMRWFHRRYMRNLARQRQDQIARPSPNIQYPPMRLHLCQQLVRALIFLFAG